MIQVIGYEVFSKHWCDVNVKRRIPEVLNETPVPDHGVQCLYVARQIHVEHQVVSDLLQHLQALSVLALVKVEYDLKPIKLCKFPMCAFHELY